MQRRFSLFGPLLLIAMGVIWILINIGTIPASNLWALTHIWPFLLIAAGVGLILRSYWKYASVLLDVVIVGGAVLAILYAPQLGWTNPVMFSMMQNGGAYFGPGEAGSGKVVTSTREISGFLTIRVDYPAQVFIKQGAVESIKIEAEDNVLPGLRTQVTNNELDIFYKPEHDKQVNPTRPVQITITVKDLTDVHFPSAGELTVEGLKADNLNLSLTGAGNVKLDQVQIKNLTIRLNGAGNLTASGTADDLDVNISGFGNFNGAELHDKTANVNISGAGNATVWVENSLIAGISGAGSINYYGSPDVSKHVSGLGNVSSSGNK